MYMYFVRYKMEKSVCCLA